MHQLKSSRGFTLIEVLLASVILIITISRMTVIYRTAAISSITASDRVKLNGSIGFIMNEIKSKIRGGNAISTQSGKGIISGVEYKWYSELNKLKSAPPRYDIDSAMMKTDKPRFYLWDVYLDISYKDRHVDFAYKEVSWQVEL
jgi:prepilin-type N-terminal cleavage/methylation domain-containing protein